MHIWSDLKQNVSSHVTVLAYTFLKFKRNVEEKNSLVKSQDTYQVNFLHLLFNVMGSIQGEEGCSVHASYYFITGAPYFMLRSEVK